MKLPLNIFLYLLILHKFFNLSHSATDNSSYYYNQCIPSTCGNSLLQFPFGQNSLCNSAYTSIHCDNGNVFLKDDENPSIKFIFLQNLTKEVYTNRSVRLVDSSVIGCGPIPPFSGLSPYSEKWLTLGNVGYTVDYRTGTLFNCTKEPDANTLSKLKKVPCLECGETKNLCYFYDGNMDHVANCRSFRTAIPVTLFSNFTGVVELRSLLQKGFVVEWAEKCNLCMEKDRGRCGYLNEERKNGEEFCFCKDGIHRNKCSDGIIINLATSGKDPRTIPHKRAITIVVGAGVGATFLLLCSCYIYYKRRPKRKQSCFNIEDDHQVLEGYFEGDCVNKEPASIETFLHNYTLGRPTRFSYKQLKKYTNNFSYKIGQGGFGSVFKGQLPNSFTIAVKVLDVSTEKSEAQFLNEVLTIGRIHHNHLVRLLGYCFEQSRRALILEYMVNGSLNKYIHQKKRNNSHLQSTSSSQDSIESIVTLSWSQLYDIAIGIAKGIAYLHEECQVKILHCDIKPHNILLDDQFRPKVADFGLALLLNRDTTHVSLTHGAGTPGYAPPEMWWMKCGPVTEKSDVYSFGMVVLEMAGMRKNFEADVSKSSEMYFPGWIFNHHVMNASSSEDSGNMDSGRVDSKWHTCEGKEVKDMVLRMELVGLWCIQFEPSKRPSMRKVVDMLEGNVVIEIPSAPFDGRFPGSVWKNNVPIAPQLETTSLIEITQSSEYLQGR